MTTWIFVFQFTMSVIVLACLAGWYLVPWLSKFDAREAFAILLIPHLFRHIGSTNLVPSVIGSMMPPTFALVVATTDFACGFLALVTLVALKRRWTSATALLWIFSIAALVDCVAIGAAGVTQNAAEHLGPQWYVVAYYVPIFVVSQSMILWRMVKGDLKGLR